MEFTPPFPRVVWWGREMQSYGLEIVHGPKLENDMQCIEEVSTHPYSTIQPHPATPAFSRSPWMSQVGRILVHLRTLKTKSSTQICLFWFKRSSKLKFLSSYSSAVLYIGIGIIKVWGFWPQIITPKTSLIFVTRWAKTCHFSKILICYKIVLKHIG